MTSSNGRNFRVTGPLYGEFTGHRWIPPHTHTHTQSPVTRSFDVFFDLRLNKRLSKQSWGCWFETPSRSLGRNAMVCVLFTHGNLSRWLAVITWSAASDNGEANDCSLPKPEICMSCRFLEYGSTIPVMLYCQPILWYTGCRIQLRNINIDISKHVVKIR